MPLCLHLDDDAMVPRLHPGDIVVADHVQPQSGQLVLARVNRRAVVRILRVHAACRDTSFELVPSNPRWPVIDSRQANVRILGRVVYVDHQLVPVPALLTPGKVYRVSV